MLHRDPAAHQDLTALSAPDQEAVALQVPFLPGAAPALGQQGKRALTLTPGAALCTSGNLCFISLGKPVAEK